jgi:hypothetical protein
LLSPPKRECHVPDPATQVSLGGPRGSAVWLRDNFDQSIGTQLGIVSGKLKFLDQATTKRLRKCKKKHPNLHRTVYVAG